jgi:CubicO group peptidase (beta-lactamase class C family)
MKNPIFIILIILVSCTPPSDKETNTKSAELTKLETKIDSLFNAHIAEDEPGAAVLVSYDGKMIIGKGYGLRDNEKHEPITKFTNLRMGSVSKQFTALTILKLVDEGKLSLSDSVYSIFPFETFKDGTTIEQLINHTSGEADAEEVFFTEWDTAKIAVISDVLSWYEIEDRSLTKPGEKYLYNNGIYEFIPSIVEKISGENFAEFAKENVFEKAGMDNTNFFNLAEPIVIENRAFCYEKDSLGIWRKVDGHFLNGLLGAGGVYTSVNDYFHYDLALRNKALFTEQTHKLIFKPSSTYEYNGEKINYALGWNVKDNAAIHAGGWFGTNTHTKRYLDKPLTIAIFMNRNTLFGSGLIENTDSLALEYVKNIRLK